jgi:hypothetical protein
MRFPSLSPTVSQGFSEHLGEIVLAVLGTALIVTVLVAFGTQTHGFFEDIVDKFQSTVAGLFERI